MSHHPDYGNCRHGRGGHGFPCRDYRLAPLESLARSMSFWLPRSIDRSSRDLQKDSSKAACNCIVGTWAIHGPVLPVFIS